MILVLGDQHFGMRRNNLMFHKIMLKECEWFLEKVTKEDSVVILGDIFDSRSSVDFKILNDAIDFYTNLISKCKNVYMLVGNHDLYYKENMKENVNFRFLEKIRKIKLIQKLSEVKIEDKKCLFVPWVDSKKSRDKAISKLKNKYDVVFGHFDTCGIYGGNVEIDTAFDTKIFDNQDIVLSGHFHKRVDKEKVKYVGSFINQTFNDVGETKGYHIIKEDGVEFIKNNSPLFEYITIDNTKQFIEDFEENKEKYVSKYKGNIIKIFLNEYNKDNSEIIEMIKSIKPLDMSVSFNKTKIELEEEDSDFNGFDGKTNIVNVINEYIDEIEDKIDSDNVSIEKIKSIINTKYVVYNNTMSA